MSIINKYKSVALSNFDLLELVKNKANVVLYPDLWKYKTIDELLDPYGACFLLFESKPKYGHWCALLKYDDGETVEFFDSYSGYPDNVLKFIPKEFKKKSKQDYPFLTKLLYESPYEIEFNDKKFQKNGKNIATCGRHAAVRILFRHLNIDQYDHFIKSLCKVLECDSDDAVTVLTMVLSGGKI